MNKRAFVLFLIDDQIYAIDVRAVRQIIQAVALTRVQNGPDLLLGLLNLRGRIIPVLDIRKQLEKGPRAPVVTDKMIIAGTNGHVLAFAVDGIETIIEWGDDDITPSAGMFPGLEHVIVGTTAYDGRTALVYEMDRLFSAQDVDCVVEHLHQNNIATL